MRKSIFTLLLAIFCLAGFSQVENDGGTISVQSGATLVIEGDYTSTNSGTIDIDGNVELKGDLVNTSGSIDAGSTGLLKFNGTSAQEITGATSTTFYCQVEIDNTSGVSLTGTSGGGANQTLGSTLTMTNGMLTLNGFDLTMSSSGVTGAGTSKYIKTNGTGQLKSVVSSTDVVFPVGNTSYNPLTLNNASTSDTYGVIATETMPSGWTTANHAVGRTWVVTEGTGGGSDLTVTPQWADADEQTSFDETDCAVGLTGDDGASFTWAASSAASGSDPYTQNGSNFSGVGKFVVGDYYHEGIELDLNLLLAGPYNGSTMNTGLTVPLADPYSVGTTVTSIPSNTVDWVKVDLLDGTTPDASSPIKSYAFFLRNDGEILNTDGGVDVKLTGVSKASYYVAVNHRVHLGACTGSAIDFTGTGPFSFDFTTSGSSFYGTNALRDMGSGVMALWAGDANGDGSVIYQGTGNDPTSISTEVLGDPGNTTGSWTWPVTNGYSSNDINMDGQVIYQGTGNDPTYISNSVLGDPANTTGSWTWPVAEQLP